jgi:hypothetical protein
MIGDYVFKGPKSPGDIDDINFEQRFLQHLEGRGLPVPRVTHVGQDHVFFGMTLLPGGMFEQEGYDFRTTREQLHEIGKEIARAVIGISAAVTPEEATEKFDLKPRLVDVSAVRSALARDDVRAALGDLLPPCQRLAEEYVDVYSKSNEALMVVNNDLHHKNSLVDPVTKEFAGIIDFARVAWCGPQVLLKDVTLWYPAPVAEAFCEACNEAGFAMSYRGLKLDELARAIDDLRSCIDRDLPYIPAKLKKIREHIAALEAVETPSVKPPSAPAPAPTARAPLLPPLSAGALRMLDETMRKYVKAETGASGLRKLRGPA